MIRVQLTMLLRAVLLVSILAAAMSAQESEYQLDHRQTSGSFTLGDVLHTVKGNFKLKQGTLQVDSSGKVSGQIVVDATSGDSGNGMRDRKMHKEVLESAKYPEIAFRPDRI